MLRTLILSTKSSWSLKLQETIEFSKIPATVFGVTGYLNELELAGVLRACEPDVVFLDTELVKSCASVVKRIESIAPATTVVAVGTRCSGTALMDIMQAGVREFLSMPFEPTLVEACLQRAANNVGAFNLPAFIPAVCSEQLAFT